MISLNIVRDYFKPKPVEVSARPDGEPLWTLEAGLEVIRAIQPAIKPLGYHVALAGGVVNVGHSNEDLDLVFLPLQSLQRSEQHGLLNYLTSVLGPCESLRVTGSGYGRVPSDNDCYRSMYKFPFRGGRRIDVFIV